MTTWWTSVIAVGGTLAGAVTTNLLQIKVSKTQRREVLLETRRTELLAAVSELAAALAAHRRAMWMLGHDPRDPEMIATSHETRAAITAPLVRLGVLAPSLRPVAKEAERAVYAMRNPDDLAALSRLREHALRASERFVDEASRVFGRLDTVSRVPGLEAR